jgi:hypothetical protein
VTATVGGRTVRRDVQSAYSYCSASDMRVHFGLGDEDRVENVTVRWVGGEVTAFGAFAAGEVFTLRQPAGGRGSASGSGSPSRVRVR